LQLNTSEKDRQTDTHTHTPIAAAAAWYPWTGDRRRDTVHAKLHCEHNQSQTTYYSRPARCPTLISPPHPRPSSRAGPSVYRVASNCSLQSTYCRQDGNRPAIECTVASFPTLHLHLFPLSYPGLVL